MTRDRKKKDVRPSGADALVAFALSEARRAAQSGRYVEALDWIAGRGATNADAIALDGEVRYRLAADLISRGQYGDAEDQLSRVAAGGTPYSVLAQARVHLLRRRSHNSRDLTQLRERFGRTCAACDGADLYVVATCEHQRGPISRAVKLDPQCLWPGLTTVFAAAAYRSGWDVNRNDPISALVRLEKHRIDEPSIRMLGALLSEFAARHTPLLHNCDAVAPVPTSRDREARRGGSIPLALARTVSDQLALPLYQPLTQIAPHLDHTEGDEVERRRGLRSAWRVDVPAVLRGRSVLLVDDILTTGTTVSVAAELLLESGVATVHGVALLHTERST